MLRAAVLIAWALPLAAQDFAFKREYLGDLAGPQSHLAALAEAVPPGNCSWRPGKDVRSVSEAFVHVAAGNYLLLEILGVRPPSDAYGTAAGSDAILTRNRDLERTITAKKRVIDLMAASFEAVVKAFSAETESGLGQHVSFFGQDVSRRTIYLRILAHANEHDGQSIAYARVIGVVPPWSRPAKPNVPSAPK